MSFFRFASKKYHVTAVDHLVPNQVTQRDMWKLKTQHALLVAEIRQIQEVKSEAVIKSSERKSNAEKFKIKLNYLRRQARSIEEQIMAELRKLHELHRLEIELLREQFKNENVEFLQKLEDYFKQQKSYIESVVYKCAMTMLEMDPIVTREFEEMMRKMLDDFGMEAEMVIWGRRRKSKWSRVKAAIKKIFKV